MAIYLSNGVIVTLNSVALSDHVTAVTINRSFDELEVTAMGDTAHKFAKGLEASTITIDFLNDTAAATYQMNISSISAPAIVNAASGDLLVSEITVSILTSWS
jgi:hypothetical protein